MVHQNGKSNPSKMQIQWFLRKCQPQVFRHTIEQIIEDPQYRYEWNQKLFVNAAQSLSIEWTTVFLRLLKPQSTKYLQTQECYFVESKKS